MNNSYVYLLLDTQKDKKPSFYVGKGVNNRAESHLTNKFDIHNPRKSRTIDSIRKNGKEPEIVYLYENLDDITACEIEISLISKYGRKGIDQGGILTNIALGGTGGNTGPITEETRKKLSKAKIGINNYSSKLSEEQVVDIFMSSLTINELATEYRVSRQTIIDIKRGVYWRDLTSKLNCYCGYHPKNQWTLMPEPEKTEKIIEIYLSDSPTHILSKKYHLGSKKIIDIREGNLYSEITEDLSKPEKIYHKLSKSERHMIEIDDRPIDDIASSYGIHRETVRNIKNRIKY